jgi:ribosomal protein L16 Arg81 hydroxylase
MKEGAIRNEALEALLTQGASLVFDVMENEVDVLAGLCNQIKARFGKTVSAGAVVSLGAGGAFKPHCDASGVLIAHLQGRKEWTVHVPPK